MSDLVFQDLISKDPSVLVLFDKFDFDDVKKSKAFTSSAARGILKDIYSRGFTNNSVCAMYVKNTAVFDFDGNLEVYRLPNEKAKSKGQIIVNEKDKADFKNRLIALLMRNDFKSLIILGREVANVLQEFGFYEAGSCLDTAKEINFVGNKVLTIETVSPLEYSLGLTERNKFISAIDQIYSTQYEVTSIDNASYVDIDTFSGYLRKLEILYDNKKIDCMGFDYETNCSEWSVPWAKLVAVSCSDRITNHAFSCALYHPEKIMHPRKKTLLKWLFAHIFTETFTTNEEYIKLAKKLEHFYKEVYPRIEELPYKEVLNDDEYFVLESLPDLVKVFKKSAKTAFEEKKKAHEEYKKLIFEAVKRLTFLINDTEYPKKLHDFYYLLDKVLSKIPVVGHNIKFDIGWCANMCIGLRNLRVKADTFGQAVAVMGQNLGTKLNLEALSVDLLGVENKWKSAFHASPRLGKGSKLRFDRVPLKLLGPYSAADAITTDLLDEYFQKKMEGQPMNLVEKEQNIAIVMFSLGEVHGFSIHPETETKLYKWVNNGLRDLRNQLVQLPTVKRFVEDRKKELPEKEASLFEFNTNTSGAQSHNAAVLFRKEYFGLKSLTSTDSGYPSADADTLKEIKKQLSVSIKQFETAKLGEKVYCDNNGELITNKNIDRFKEACTFCDNLIKTSGFSQLNNMYYKVSYDEKNDRPLDKFIAVFKLVGATKTGRLSSRFHLAPKTGGVRYVYCSAWSKDNIRKYQFSHEPGIRYEPLYGLMDVVYEDGTTEKVSYGDLLNRGYTKDEIESIYNSNQV